MIDIKSTPCGGINQKINVYRRYANLVVDEAPKKEVIIKKVMSIKYKKIAMLDYLNKLEINATPSDEEVQKNISISKNDYDVVKALLRKYGLINGGKSHICINAKGREYLEANANDGFIEATITPIKGNKLRKWERFSQHPSWQFWGIIITVVIFVVPYIVTTCNDKKVNSHKKEDASILSNRKKQEQLKAPVIVSDTSKKNQLDTSNKIP